MPYLRPFCRAIPLLLIAALLSFGLAPAQAAPAAPAPATTSTAEEEPLREINGVDAFAEASVLVSGLVYDQDGALLDNIQVAAVPAADPTADPVASALTYENGPDSHGAYVLQLPPGDYKIRFSTPEWRHQIYRTAFYGGGSGDTVTVTEGNDLTLDDVTLQLENGVPVTGVVRGPAGTPLPQVEVALYRFWSDGDYWSIDWEVTDSQGRYTFPAVPRERSFSVFAYGEYDWDGTPLGYANTWLGGAPSAGTADRFTLPADSTGRELGDITLRPGVRVHGTVTLPDVVEDDEVWADLLLRNPDGTWDYVDFDYVGGWDDFAFEFPAVARGATYTVEFWSWDLGTTYLGGGTDRDTAQTFTLDDSSPAELDLGEILIGSQTTRVTGSVVDTDGDGTSSDIQVWRQVAGVWEHYDWRWTREDGTFRLRLPWDGTWTIEANPDSGASVFLGGGASPTDPATETFATTESVPSLALDPIVVPVDPPKVVGHVLDENGAPVAGARVALYESYPCGTGMCWDWWDSKQTNDNGRYVFRWLDETATYTVSAEKQNAGYDETFLGGGAAPETATTFTVGSGEVLQLDDIAFTLPPGVVRGTVTTEDGGTFDEALVELYRWDELNGYFDYQESRYLDSGETDYAFNHLESGTYAVYAESWDWETGTTPYVGTWRGGAHPVAPDSPGTFLVTPEVNPLEDIDIQLRRGVLLTGTVTRGDGAPLAHANVGVEQWIGDGASAYTTWVDGTSTDAQGHYSVLVPKETDLWVSADRDGYESYALGGSYPDAGKTSANTLTTGTTDLTHDFGMAPAWGDVGTVAGVQDEDCLSNSWWNGRRAVTFDDRKLRIRSDGTIRLAGHEYGDLFGDTSRDPGLTPLQSWSEVTWGIDQGGERLCVLWNGSGNTRQAFLETADGPGLDVTYNYDVVSWAPDYPKAGWSAGEGPSGDQLVFAGWDATDGLGYTDSNLETGLVHNSLNSAQPGRYQFHFDGFEPRAAAPANATAPAITGNLALGETLTGGPGTWTLGGEPATGLEFDYRWFNVSGEPVGNTYVIQSGDLGRRIWLEVRAWKPGHDWTTAETMVRIPVGPPAATNTVPPSISPASPTINEVLTADPGTWEVEEGASLADVTFSYRWFRDGNRIWGETGQTYTTLESDALKDISVRVKATRLDHAPVKVFSAPVTVGDLPPVELLTAPALSGEPRVGDTVSVTSGTWDAAGQPVEISYRFASGYLSRTADAGTPNAYTLKPTDLNRLLTVTVVAQAPGHRSTKWVRTIGPVAAGDATFGQMTIEVVDDADGTPVEGAFVNVCEQETWTCLPGSRTDASGLWTASAWADVPYQVYVYPPDGSAFRSASRVVTVPTAGSTTQVRLSEPAPPPPNVSIPTATGTYDGLPTVYWQESQTINITGCAGIANPTYTVTFTDGTPQQTGPLTMGTVGGDGLATYTATIPPFYPSHGETTISTNVPADCAPGTPPTAVSIYIDPSGVVTDQFGRTIEGATVTLQRADSAAGPYVTVPDGSDIMSEDNRTNPDLTDEVGFFRWDVVEGWYRVQVDAAGCDSATTQGMPVLPARVDLLIKLTCDVPGPEGTPGITGTPKVGETLTTDTGIWDSLFDVDVQWLRNGTPISGATGTSYQATTADVGAALSVRHLIKREDYVQEEGRGAPVSFASVTRTSAATAAVAPAAAPGVTTAAQLAGSGKVGTMLTATAPTWNQSGVANSVTWLRDGVAISGESGSTYLVRAGDVGAQIQARYTGTKAGHANGTSTSNAVTGVVGDAPTAQPPTVTGTAKVGQTLSAAAPAWSLIGVTTGYQWLRDGVPIDGATGSSYTLVTQDAARSISVRVTGAKPGHQPGQAESAEVVVAKLSSTTTAKLPKPKVAAGRTATVAVVVKVPGVAAPKGTVTIKEGKKVLAKGTLGKGGKVTIKLPKLKKGQHKLVASYAGGATVSASKSKVVTLTIT